MGGGRSRRIAVEASGRSLAPLLLSEQRRIRSRARRVFARPQWRGPDCSRRSQPRPRRQPAGWTLKCGSPSRKDPSRLPMRTRRAIRASRPAGLRSSGPGTFRRRTAAVLHCALSSWNVDNRAKLNARYKGLRGCLRSGLFVIIASAVHNGDGPEQGVLGRLFLSVDGLKKDVPRTPSLRGMATLRDSNPRPHHYEGKGRHGFMCCFSTVFSDFAPDLIERPKQFPKSAD